MDRITDYPNMPNGQEMTCPGDKMDWTGLTTMIFGCKAIFVLYIAWYLHLLSNSLYYFASILDPDQARLLVGPGQDPDCGTIFSLSIFLSFYLFTSFANILDPDQAWQNVTPDLEPYCLIFFKTSTSTYTYMYILAISSYLELYYLTSFISNTSTFTYMYILSISPYLGSFIANSMDPDQARQNVASDLEPYCLTFLKTTSPTYIYMYILAMSSYLGSFIANSLDPDQARQNVASDLEPYCLNFLKTTSPTYIYMYILAIYSYLGSFIANSLDPDQARQNVASDLEPYCLTHLKTTSPTYIYMYILAMSSYLGFFKANNLDPDQARENVAPHLELYCLIFFIICIPPYILSLSPYLGSLLANSLDPDQTRQSVLSYLELYCLVFYTYLHPYIYMYIKPYIVVFSSLAISNSSKNRVGSFAFRVADAHMSLSQSGCRMTRVFVPHELQYINVHRSVQDCYSASILDLDQDRQKVGSDLDPKCLMVCSCIYIPVYHPPLHTCTKRSPLIIILTFTPAHLLTPMLTCIYYIATRNIGPFALRVAGDLWSLSCSECNGAELCISNGSHLCGSAQDYGRLSKFIPERNTITLFLLAYVCCCCCCQYYYCYDIVKLDSFIYFQDIQWVFNTCQNFYISITLLHVYTCNLATVELLGIPVYMFVYIYLKTLNRLLDTCMIIYCTGQSIFEFTSVLLRNEVPVLGVFAVHFTLYKLLINFSTCQLSPLLARQLSLYLGSFRELNSLQCIKGLASLILSLKWI